MGFEEYQDEKMKEYEARCKRCGVCCGAGSDPCLDLKTDAEGRYYCASYDNRFGQRTTVQGLTFSCVPIRDVLLYAPPTPDCGYAADSLLENPADR